MLYALQKHCLAIYLLRNDDEKKSNTYSTVPYITFCIWGSMSLNEVENMAPLQLFTLGGGGGGGGWVHASPENFGDFRCSVVHSGAFWGIQRNTQSF